MYKLNNVTSILMFTFPTGWVYFILGGNYVCIFFIWLPAFSSVTSLFTSFYFIFCFSGLLIISSYFDDDGYYRCPSSLWLLWQWQLPWPLFTLRGTSGSTTSFNIGDDSWGCFFNFDNDSCISLISLWRGLLVVQLAWTLMMMAVGASFYFDDNGCVSLFSLWGDYYDDKGSYLLPLFNLTVAAITVTLHFDDRCSSSLCWQWLHLLLLLLPLWQWQLLLKRSNGKTF